MNHSILKMLIVTCGFSLIIIGTAYSLSEKKYNKEASELVSEKTPKATLKTTTLALPEKTNNAWEMKPFELSDTKGVNHTLDEWKGKVIMLNFWASWCAPCQFEIPRFVGYQNKFSKHGLQIVGIGLDDVTTLANVERSLEMNYPSE